MATAKDPLTGVKRRKSNGQYYFEKRCCRTKLFFSNIKSAEVGALCYDIVQCYNESETMGGKAPTKLNYPGYSRSLQLEPLPSDFDIKLHKKAFKESVLRQAEVAAGNLPESLKRSIPVVGCQSPSNRSSPHQNVHDNPPRVVEGKQDLPGVCTNDEAQDVFLEISEINLQCHSSYTSKAHERRELELMVANIGEDSGIVSIPRHCPDKFHYLMDCLKQYISTDERIRRRLEMAEQGYKSEESKCSQLRKILEDHNLKSIPGILMGDGSKMTGRQRADESERLPELRDSSVPSSPRSPDLSDSDFWTRLLSN